MQQNYVEQMSDLFVEHRYYKFQDRDSMFFILQQWNIKTSRFNRGTSQLQ